MQRERRALDSFPELIDLNQGSLPGDTSMDQPASGEKMLNPVEHRLSSYMLSHADGTVNCMAPSNFHPSFNHWGCGESSSGAGNMHDGAIASESKMRMGMGWPASSFNSCPESDARTEIWSLEPSTVSSAGYAGNGRFPSTNDCSLNYSSPNISSKHRFIMADDCHNSVGARLANGLSKHGHSETEPILALNASSSNVRTSSVGFRFPEANDASGSSFGTWGSSSQRKLEGTSGQFYSGGSSSSNLLKEKHVMQHPGPDCHAGSPGTLSVSSDRLSSIPINNSQRPNPSSGMGMSRISPGHFPSVGPRIDESVGHNFAVGLDHRHVPVPFDVLGGASTRNLGAYASQMSAPVSTPDYSHTRFPMNLNNLNHPYLTHANEARGMHSYPGDGSCGSRGDGSSSSYLVPQERGSRNREEVNVRSSRGNNMEHLMDVSPPKARNIPPDEIDWSFAPAAFASSRNHSLSSRCRISSDGQSSAAWLPYQSQASLNHHQLLEPASLFPGSHVESDSGFRRSPCAHLSYPSSLDGAASSSQASGHQLPQNSAAFLMAVPDDDFNGWRAMTGIEGRHHLVRRVFNAMQRGIHVQSEDYRLADPFINGFVELHDRHRDMRLDVDNMSYEELLALEEQIGNVNTGLSDEKIRDSMKLRKHKAIGFSPNFEPCCICQEEYVDGDDIGILECGHEFHTGCIKQWLTLKNICPICKITALDT